MTKKELQELEENYRKTIRECFLTDKPYKKVVEACNAIALEECYNHSERGQRLQVFFKALDLNKRMTVRRCTRPDWSSEQYDYCGCDNPEIYMGRDLESDPCQDCKYATEEEW